MEETEDQKFYCSLTKKKLQVLCKRHGLSPYMTKPKLVNSLYSFFKKKNLSSESSIESLTVDFVTGVPMEMMHASKDSQVKISYAMEKDNKINDYQVVECDEELSRKAPDFKTIQVSLFPDNDKNDSTFTCPEKETLSMQSAPRCRGIFFDGGVDSASVNSEKNNILSETEAGKNLATKIPPRSLFRDLEKSSKPFSPLEFHASSGKGINIIVDLDTSPSDVLKSLENEVCNCYCVHNSKFQSLREELELLGRKGCSENRLSLWRTNTEKPFDHTQKAHSISCNNMDPDIACQQKKESCPFSRGSVLCDVVVPMTKFGKGHDDDDSAVPETDVFAEEREHVNLIGDAETSTNFHPNMPLKEKPIVKVGLKRKRPSSECNQRSTRSTCLTKRVLRRRSMSLVGAQGL